eukprot:NODE_2169_length_972_cov_272.985915_g1782_i0.p1 GENE.NODE_2169_length_972_cov_272.985915_g1782_i0~~NODE_2169_length_972_cov_272.985915_g1782_i0.p1  ORF type:complete len:298 (-),score=93.78 NODE_2169_length_972_cov_272.985915_g1782_i0:79-951(-)
MGAAFCERWYPKKAIYMPQPTWPNHIPLMRDSLLHGKNYRYYNYSDCSLDFKGMMADLEDAEEGSLVLLHACAHNPTGVDPSMDQWKQLAVLMKQKGHFPFFDAAYQGFASGDPERDAAAVRYFADEGFNMLVCQSFAKNMGLYGQRTGAVHFVCQDAEEVKRVDSQLKIVIRPMYSNPPVHGARLVAKILGDAELTAQWRTEVKEMADRIISMRHALVGALKELGSTRDWSHVTNQIGMFSYTGLNKAQVQRMVEEFSVYMTADGRISVAGLNTGNVEYVAKCMHEVTK